MALGNPVRNPGAFYGRIPNKNGDPLSTPCLKSSSIGPPDLAYRSSIKGRFLNKISHNIIHIILYCGQILVGSRKMVEHWISISIFTSGWLNHQTCPLALASLCKVKLREASPGRCPPPMSVGL